MKKLFTLHSAFSLILLLIAISAFVSGIKEGVRAVQDAAFFPVAAFALILSYVFGFSAISMRRVLPIVLLTGFIFAFIESAKLMEPIKNIIHSIPQFELELIRWVLEKETPKSAPDVSIIQLQFSEIVRTAGEFTSRVLSASVKHPPVREFLWDMPLILLAVWAGWRTGRHNQTFLALVPMVGLQAFILNYTGKDTFSLQIAIFAFVMLVGINQTWNIIPEKTENSERAVREIYPAVILLSFVLAIGAGFVPSISIKDVTQKLAKKDNFAEAIGLEKEIIQISTLSGLPRQHLIGLSPNISNTIIFKVKTGELAPTENIIIKEIVPRHYWRWLTYDIYNGHGWSTSQAENASYSANQYLFPVASDRYKLSHQQVEKSFTQDSRLYWSGSLVRVNQPFNASWRVSPRSLSPESNPLFITDMLGANTKAQTYQADSFVPIISVNQLRDSSQDYPQEIRASYLSLPDSVPQRVLDLAKELTADMTNPYEKAKAIEAYLRTYPYSLDVTPPLPDQDVADYFLFDQKTGYCDYYATSMVVLSRAAGLPARLVIGYANGTYDSTQAEYTVREANAHSWVEVYFAGVGWVEFEPTASQLPIFLPEELPKEVGPSVASSPMTSELGVSASAKLGYSIKQDIPSFAVLLMIIISLATLWLLRAQGLLQAHDSICSIYEYVYYHGKKIYKDAPLYETPSIFAKNLQDKLQADFRWLSPAQGEIRLLTNLYLQEIYSSHPITKDERIHAEKVWRKLFWRLLYARVILARRIGAKPPKESVKNSSQTD
jgi:transglutaminase-like putative cysteine protease